MLEVVVVAAILSAATLYLARFAWQVYQGKRSTCGCGEDTCAKGTKP